MRDIAHAFPAAPETPEEWREYYRVLDQVSPRDKTALQVEQFRAIESPERPDGLPDFPDFFAAREAFPAALPEQDRAAVEAEITKRRTPTERRYLETAELMREYSAIPRYRVLSQEQLDLASDALALTGAVARQTNLDTNRALFYLASRGPISREALALACLVKQLGRQAYWNAHPELAVWFGDLSLDLVEDLPAHSPELGGGGGRFAGLAGFSGLPVR